MSTPLRTTLVSPAYQIEEATLVLSEFVPTKSLSFATFPVVSGVAHIDVDKPMQIGGWLTGIIARRTVDSSEVRFNCCSFSLEVTDADIQAGHCTVNLTAHKEVTFRLRGKDQASHTAIFNFADLERGGPTFDLPVNDVGESAVLAEPGQYLVSAVDNGKSAMKRFAISSTDAEHTIIEFEL